MVWLGDRAILKTQQKANNKKPGHKLHLSGQRPVDKTKNTALIKVIRKLASHCEATPDLDLP